jgi:hypothetical protein
MTRIGSIFLMLLFLFLTRISVTPAAAQYSIRDSVISFPMIGVIAGFQLPGGDLADRFGNNFNVGGVFQWKFKNNVLVGVEGNFLFGDDVKEKFFLDRYRTPDGNIIDGNGKYSIVSLSMRGMKAEVKAGKIFPVAGPNKNSGLMATVGLGYLHHKILIETPNGPIPYLEGDYRKGFDRFSSGVSVTEFMGYMNFGNSRLINFYAGLEFTQAFTRNRRMLNFDSGTRDDKARTDLFFGIRLGWVFPLYKRVADKIYIN